MMSWLTCTAFMVLLSLCSQVISTSLDTQWRQFKRQYRSSTIFDAEEEARRKEIFRQNLLEIEQHNSNPGQATHRLGINEYADMTHREFINQMAGFEFITSRSLLARAAKPSTSVDLRQNVPEAKDWLNSASPVKNQLDPRFCGSCWAFSAAAAVEAHYHIQTGRRLDLSEQQLVDCTPEADKCNGGAPDIALNYIMENGGINYESCYPYTAQNGTCRYNPNCEKVTITDFTYTEDNSEDDLKRVVGTIGPVVTSVDCSPADFKQYKSGIYSSNNCNTPTHLALVVGYGNEGGQDYWLVKNSFGTSWGENGYLKLARNQNNMCLVGRFGVYPII